MKFRISSDTHLEFRPNGYELEGLETDSESTLLLAGDIGSPKGSLNPFLQECGSRFANVCYVLGNHEHYNGTITQTYKEIKAQGLPENVHLLENEFFDIPGMKIRVFGATLWTDCNRNNPVTKGIVKRYLSDFNYAILKNGKSFTPDDAYELFRGTLDWMNTAASETPSDYKRIFLTHHGVTAGSIHPKYGTADENFGFYSEIGNELIDWGVDLAVHGHTHLPVDCMVGDRCRVIAAPVGYPGENKFVYDTKEVEL